MMVDFPLLLFVALAGTCSSALAELPVAAREFEVGLDGGVMLEGNELNIPAGDSMRMDHEPDDDDKKIDPTVDLSKVNPSPKPEPDNLKEESNVVAGDGTSVKPAEENQNDIPVKGNVHDDFPNCQDLHEKCAFWASVGECEILTGNPVFMFQSCSRSCNLCGKGDIQVLLQNAIEVREGSKEPEFDSADVDCEDKHEKCALWESIGECEPINGNPAYMYINCPKSCNLCGKGDLSVLLAGAMKIRNPDLSISGWGEVQNAQTSEKFALFANDVDRYMLEEVNIEDKYKSFKKRCQNRHTNCLLWAYSGECEKNPDFMEMQCAPSCKTCHKISFNYRCPMPENIPEVNAWKPGDLNKMFDRIVAEVPNVNILSQPSPDETKDGPWVLTIDSFLTDEECERLIELGHQRDYKRSADVGKMNFDGTFEESVNDGRTSTNAWCVEECYNDTYTQSVLQKIQNLTGVPDTYSENLQLLRYEPGQYYHTHHDYIPTDVERPQGVRLLTVFLYLNDPEAGGGTNFPDLFGGITVMPKKGSVLLWPSVLDHDPDAQDKRTMHQALPVEKGLKFGANAWVHQRDFKTPQLGKCT